MPIIIQHCHTPVGELIIGSLGESVCLADWRYRKKRAAVDRRVQNELGEAYVEGDSTVLTALKQQLTAYFGGHRRVFDVPLRLAGTDFQRSVWRALQDIPYGTTVSYQELADTLGKPGAVRAVASANGANALSIVVPCHRVVASNGQLAGYAGGLRAKRQLLQLEAGERIGDTVRQGE